jgi:hypothetical protein
MLCALGIMDWGQISLFFGGMAPAVGFWLAVTWDLQKRSRTERPPQEEKLLRPAGYSLALRLDELHEQAMSKFGLASGLSALAGIGAALTARFVVLGAPFLWTAGSLTFVIVTAIPATVLVRRVFLNGKEARNVRLGLRGEQAVAETLHQLTDCGFRAFHDLQAGQDWNIDHVAVGRKGVFLIETKARRRRVMPKGKPDHIVKYDGQMLVFPFAYNSKAVPQAERSSRWLADYLEKKTGESVAVEAIIVLPGWWVDSDDNLKIKAMNCNYLLKYLSGRKDVLGPTPVRRIVTALEEKCRTLEF